MADRAKFLDFLDMIDGGGAGQRGNQFEGGGIFSMLANLMPINPYGSEDPTRRRARDEFFAEQGITPEQAAATPAVIRALPFDAGPITSDMRPRERTFPQSNQFIPEMPVMPAAQTNRMMDANVVPTSGPSPRVAEEITRMRNAQRIMDINAIPSMPVEPRPSVMSVGPAQPTSAGVPMGPQPQMQTSMVGSTGFEEGDMRGRIDGTISGGVTPSVLGSPSLRVRSSADTQPMTFEEFAQQQSILPSVGLDQLRSLYENYLNFIRRNNTIGNLTR
tara:strand:+ start:1448 stop:2272 length:825 start_codon:yes stop_codon:yes gene_type:complete